MVLEAETAAGTNGFSIDPKGDRGDVSSMSKPIVIFTIGTQDIVDTGRQHLSPYCLFRLGRKRPPSLDDTGWAGDQEEDAGRSREQHLFCVDGSQS